MDLTKKKCEPCEGGVKPFDREEANKYISWVSPEWEMDEEAKEIKRKFKFEDFKKAIAFVNKVADLAENEGHHPDIKINYSRVKLSLSTHAIGGLSPNDFILASKIDLLKN